MVRRTGVSPKRDEDFAQWYQAVVRAADLAEMSHVRGCMVIKPWGYGVWEQIQSLLDARIKATGHENAYFPLFIPLEYIQREAAHVEGFAKEMAVVTHHRLEQRDGRLVPAGKLDEPLIVRPTSETIIGASMAGWLTSYRDLPIKLNQWSNAVRWELRPRVFLRTTEFLWQEGHTAHETEAEALEETHTMLGVYRELLEDEMALALIVGEKPPSERFPGAERTFTLEAIMQDGRALQAGTSHYLGQNFARAAGIRFTGRTGELQYAFTTSWGVSTRLIGGAIMTHGDDDGLRLPPRIAPKHVIIIPLLRGGDADPSVLAYVNRITAALAQGTFAGGRPIIVHVDRRDQRPVEKKWQWIKRGAPIVCEVGPREAERGELTVWPRHQIDRSTTVALDAAASVLAATLDEIQQAYLAEARAFLHANVRDDVTTVGELREHFNDTNRPGFVRAKWCGAAESLDIIAEMGVTIRCLPLQQSGIEGRCVLTGAPARTDAIFAKAY